MSQQQSSDSCGSHGADNKGRPLFDYTCDDCMLRDTLDPEDIDRFGNRYSDYENYMRAGYGDEYYEKRIKEDKKSAQVRKQQK